MEARAARADDEAGGAQQERRKVGQQIRVPHPRGRDEVSRALELANRRAIEPRRPHLVELREREADDLDAVGVDETSEQRGRGGGDEDPRRRALAGRRVSPAKTIDDPFCRVRREDQRAQHEESVAVDPQELQRRQQPESPRRPRRAGQHRQGGGEQHQRDQLGSLRQSSRDHEQARKPGEGQRPGAMLGTATQHGEAHDPRPGGRLHQYERGRATGAIEEPEPDLVQPVDVDPGPRRARVREEVDARHRAGLQNELPGAKVPPDIEVGQRGAAEQKRQRRQRDQQGSSPGLALRVGYGGLHRRAALYMVAHHSKFGGPGRARMSDDDRQPRSSAAGANRPAGRAARGGRDGIRLQHPG